MRHAIPRSVMSTGKEDDDGVDQAIRKHRDEQRRRRKARKARDCSAELTADVDKWFETKKLERERRDDTDDGTTTPE